MITLATDSSPLSLRLREGTRSEHNEAEHSRFVSMLMSGELDQAAYTDLAAQHHFIYTALESVTDSIHPLPQGDTLLFDELTRTPSIAADLAFLVGPDWETTLTPLPATIAYVAAIESSASSLPRYAAHAYTRYLGDLSGGQVIKRMLERHYGLGPEGISFYTFQGIPKSQPFKNVYRERLDSLAFTEDERAEAVAEATIAFTLNTALFAELGAIHCTAPVPAA